MPGHLFAHDNAICRPMRSYTALGVSVLVDACRYGENWTESPKLHPPAIGLTSNLIFLTDRLQPLLNLILCKCPECGI